MTPVTSQQSSTHQPLPLPLQPSTQLCDVCLIAPRDGVALVPCVHSRFCMTCADTVAFSGLAFSGPAFSVAPILHVFCTLRTLLHFQALHFQVLHFQSPRYCTFSAPRRYFTLILGMFPLDQIVYVLGQHKP